MGRSCFPQQVRFYDTTLRDGEQTIGVTFDPDEKVMIAELLDDIGVQRIEVGMPVVSRQDREAASRIVNRNFNAEPWGFARCIKSDIDACLDVGLRAIVVEIPTSSFKMKANNFTEESVKEKLLRSLQYAKQQGLYTAFFAVDATRSSLEFLQEMYMLAVTEGRADEVVLVDTLGVATPETMFFLTKKLKQRVQVPVMTHCHNDFGLATACSLASAKGGAEYIHVTINGLGEKTGNTDIAEAALAAKLYGIDTHIDLKKLRPLAKRLQEISQIQLSPLKPVVGQNVFKRESGVAVAQLVKHPPAVEGYAPEVVGAKREILLGKKSGKASIEWMLQNINVKVSDEQVEEILASVKNYGMQKRGIIETSEFRDIVERVIQSRIA
jgi:isopropylmalate/homocitrate/citramalate synthase